MTNQVLIRTPILHGRICGMQKADLIKAEGEKLTVRVGTRTFTVNKADTVSLAGPNQTKITTQLSPARSPISRFTRV